MARYKPNQISVLAVSYYFDSGFLTSIISASPALTARQFRALCFIHVGGYKVSQLRSLNGYYFIKLLTCLYPRLEI
jgi:hypothetical protein